MATDLFAPQPSVIDDYIIVVTAVRESFTLTGLKASVARPAIKDAMLRLKAAHTKNPDKFSYVWAKQAYDHKLAALEAAWRKEKGFRGY